MVKSFKAFLVTIAVVSASFQLPSMGAATVTASKNYVDMKTKVEVVTNADVGVVGYTVGTNTNCVFVSTNYVDSKLGKIKTDSITDGTNTIYASRDIWEVRIVYSNDWSLRTVIGFPEEDVANYWSWPYWDNDGWYIDKGDGGAVYRLSTNESAIELLYEEGAKKAIWDRIPSGEATNYVGKLALTNDIPTNALAGQTYDFSRNFDIIRATADIVQLLGGTVTNNPTANQGGN